MLDHARTNATRAFHRSSEEERYARVDPADAPLHRYRNAGVRIVNDQDAVNTAELPTDAISVAARKPLSKRQIKSAAFANERLTRQTWKSLLPDARALWTKVPPEDLARVQGNIHALAGLVQLRYHTNRQDADQQVQKFFLDHAPAAPAGTA